MSKVFRRFMSIVGNTTLEHVRQLNGAEGPQWAHVIISVGEQKEKENPDIKKMRIKGARAHKSHENPTDPGNVITIQMLTEEEARVESIHVHLDGSITKRESQKGMTPDQVRKRTRDSSETNILPLDDNSKLH